MCVCECICVCACGCAQQVLRLGPTCVHTRLSFPRSLMCHHAPRSKTLSRVYVELLFCFMSFLVMRVQ